MAEQTDSKVYNTPYDDAFKTMISKCTRLVIPVINEMFDEHYTGKEKIVQTPNEFYVSIGNGDDKQIATDSVFTIAGVNKRYHLECQSSTDGTILIRMFEYDVQIALDDAEVGNAVLTVRFPNSGIMYLRSTRNTPKISTIRIETPEGHTSYSVHTLKVKEYSIDEIFEKRLWFLIPFHIFTYEKKFSKIDSDKAEQEKLKGLYADIYRRLEELCEKGLLHEHERLIIIELTRKVIDSIARNHEEVKKAGEIMGGKVLELEADVLLNEFNSGKEEGREEGEQRRQAEIAKRMKDDGMDPDLIAKYTGLTMKEINSL